MKVRNYFISFFLKNNSNLDACDENTFQQINEVHKFSCLIARSLGLTNREVGKALTYFYKIIRNCPQKIDKKFYITVCLYIANKSGNDFLIFIDLFIKQYLLEMSKLKNKDISFLEQSKQQIKEKIFGKVEMEILTLIGFDCDVDLPFYYLDKYSFYIPKEILSEANKRCNDTYHLPLCLFFHPLEIACTTILMSSENQNCSLPKGWEKYFSDDIEMSVLENMKNIINEKIYSRSKKQNVNSE